MGFNRAAVIQKVTFQLLTGYLCLINVQTDLLALLQL